MKSLPIKMKIFLSALDIITIVSLYFFITGISSSIKNIDIKFIFFFVVLMALTESFTVFYKNLSFSTSFAVSLAAFILGGPLVAIIVVVLGFSFRILKYEGKYEHIFNIALFKTIFNYCVFVLPIILGHYVFLFFGGKYDASINTQLIPITAFCVINFLANVLIISMLSSILSGSSLLFAIIGNIRLGALNLLAMGPLGVLAAYIFKLSSYGGLSLFIFPIILARFTFSMHIEAKTKYIQTVDVIMNAMEARDKYTQGHSKRVAEISCKIARELKYNEWKIEDLNMAALLHDVGKIGIDDQILNKPDKLTNEEFDIIKNHPEIGYKILKDINDIDKVLSIVRNHHERYDGGGYPDGKKSDELLLEVFIVQLADSIDAMSTDRPYRKSMSEEEILSEIIRCKGTQFHPEVVDAYLRIIEKEKS